MASIRSRTHTQITTLDKGHIQLFCSHARKVGSPTCRRWQGMGEGVFPLPFVIPWHSPERAGTVFLLSHPPAQLPCTPTKRVTSSVLPRQTAKPAFPCSVAGEGQGQFSHPHSARAISLDATEARGEGKEDNSFPYPGHHMADKRGKGQSCSHPPAPFLGAVEQGQGYSSLVLQPVWGRANSVQLDPHHPVTTGARGIYTD